MRDPLLYLFDAMTIPVRSKAMLTIRNGLLIFLGSMLLALSANWRLPQFISGLWVPMYGWGLLVFGIGLGQEWKAKHDDSGEVHIQIGQPKTSGSWATYYHPISVIEVHGSGKDEPLQVEYCKTIIGMDHEYLHHVLFGLEGKEACEGLDKLAGTLVDHCQWVGLNLVIEGRTAGFSNRLDP